MSLAATFYLFLLGIIAGGSARADPGAAVITPREVAAPILVYHRVTCLMGYPTRMDERMTVGPEDFLRQMESLRSMGFTPITLGELCDGMMSGDALPTKPVVLTFDDGWSSHASEVLPALKRLGFRGTFFVHTDAIGTPGHLTWDQVRELRAAGMEIGSHTVSHAHLTALDDASLARELIQSRERLEHEVGADVDLLAYPFGERDERVESAARAAGYRAAVTTDPGIIQRAGECMRLRRGFVGFMDGPGEFESVLSSPGGPEGTRSVSSGRGVSPGG